MKFFPIVTVNDDQNIEICLPDHYLFRDRNGHIKTKGVMFDPNLLSFNLLYTYIVTEDKRDVYLFDMKYASHILGQDVKDTYIIGIFKWIKENLSDTQIEYLCIYDTKYTEDMAHISSIQTRVTIFNSNVDQIKDVYPDIRLIRKNVIIDGSNRAQAASSVDIAMAEAAAAAVGGGGGGRELTSRIKIDAADLANFRAACQLIKLEVELHCVHGSYIEFDLLRSLFKMQGTRVYEQELLEQYGTWV